MSASSLRRIGAIVAAGSLFLVLAGPVAATITPPCSGTGTSTSGGEIDLTTATEWHLKSTDTAGGSGQSTVEMQSAMVSASALGLSVPIAGGSGDGDTQGSVSGVSVAAFAYLGARFVVSGSASGEGGSCSGSITIILDDVNPALTLFGGGGLLLAVIGLVAIFMGARSAGGMGTRILAAILGLLGGAGLGLALEQFGVLDPTSFVGLAIAILGFVLGFVLAGRLGPGPAPLPA
ncbi:MAG: hypothetical protein AB1736_14010 [Chloroflexota bacterium]